MITNANSEMLAVVFSHLDLAFVAAKQHHLRRRELQVIQAGVDAGFPAQHNVSESEKTLWSHIIHRFTFHSAHLAPTNVCVLIS